MNILMIMIDDNIVNCNYAGQDNEYEKLHFHIIPCQKVIFNAFVSECIY